MSGYSIVIRWKIAGDFIGVARLDHLVVTFGQIPSRQLLKNLDRPATLDHTLSMVTSWHGRGIVSFIVVCVLLLFFFPLVQGPFQATHGPTTAFRARMAFLVLIFAIIYGALGILDRFSKSIEAPIGGSFLVRAPIPTKDIAVPQSVTLRC